MNKSLDELRAKHGPHPNILATKADYITDITCRLALLKDAFILASCMADKKNMTLIAGSIAEIYVDEIKDKQNGSLWTALLRFCLRRQPDETEYRQYVRFRHKMREKGQS